MKESTAVKIVAIAFAISVVTLLALIYRDMRNTVSFLLDVQPFIRDNE